MQIVSIIHLSLFSHKSLLIIFKKEVNNLCKVKNKVTQRNTQAHKLSHTSAPKLLTSDSGLFWFHDPHLFFTKDLKHILTMLLWRLTANLRAKVGLVHPLLGEEITTLCVPLLLVLWCQHHLKAGLVNILAQFNRKGQTLCISPGWDFPSLSWMLDEVLGQVWQGCQPRG